MTTALCLICAGTLGYGEISSTTCGHLYHEDCLQKWLRRARSCPQCRKPISEDTVIRKLYFNVEDGVEFDDKENRKENNEQIRKYQEWLSNERRIDDDLMDNLRLERRDHQFSRLQCKEIKEEFTSSKKKALCKMTTLQNEIKEIRMAVKKCHGGDRAFCKNLGLVNWTLDNLKHGEARHSSYFLRRIWKLMIEIKNRKLEMKDLEAVISKLSRETDEQNIARVEKRRFKMALMMIQDELNLSRSDLEVKEKQIEELSAKNALLTILVAFEKERSRTARQNFLQMAEPSSLRENGFISSFDRSYRFLSRCFSPSIDLYTDLLSMVENYNVEKVFLYTTMSVLSYYVATWLDVHPAVMLAVTGVVTAVVKSNDVTESRS